MRKIWFQSVFFIFLVTPALARSHDPSCFSYREMREQVSRVMSNEFGLRMNGLRGWEPTGIEEISVECSTHNRATLEEARAYVVFVTERLLSLVNENSKLSSQLEVHPFLPDRVKVMIHFIDPLGNKYSEDAPTLVLSSCGSIDYFNNDAFTGRSVDLLEESYAVAERIVKTSYSQLPEHVSTSLESAIDDVLYKYTVEMADCYGLYVWGLGHRESDRLEGVSARFTAFYPVSKEQGRVLQVRATERLLELVNNHETLKEHPLTSKQIRMRVDFKKTNYVSYTDGTLESVRLEDDILTYFQDPLWQQGEPLDNLCRPCLNLGTEPYSEARQLAASTPLHINMKPRKR